MFSFTFILLPTILFCFTDFSETVISSKGILSLFGIKAYCYNGSILRGIALQKPTPSTIRWALQCVPMEVDGRHISHHVSDQVECLNDPNGYWLSKIDIRCPPERVLYGLSIELYNKDLCGVHYLCQKVDGALCLNYNKVESNTIPYPNNVSKESLTTLPIVAGDYYAGIQGFRLNVNKGSMKYMYSWCALPQYDNNNNLDNLAKDNDLNIEMYFRLDDSKSVKYIVDVIGGVKKTFKDAILFSFYPHYIKPLKGSEQESIKQSCIYEIDKDVYFDYMEEYYINCSNSNNCGEQILNNYNVSKQDLNKCIQNMNENRYLNSEMKIIKDNKYSIPSLFINSRLSQMKTKEEIFSHLCHNTTNILLPQCQDILSSQNESSASTFKIIIIILISIILVAVCLRLILFIFKLYYI